MKAPLLTPRFCAVAISLVHLAIFASLFVPYMADPRVSLWLALLPTLHGLFAFSRAPYTLAAFLMFVPLFLPLLAVWGAAKPATRLISLVGLWISQPLVCIALFFWSLLALELYTPSSVLHGLLSCIPFVPPVGFVLSLLLCFVAARYVRRLLAEKAVAPARNTQALRNEEEVEYAGSQEIPPAVDVKRNQLLPGWMAFGFLTFSGFLCQVLFIMSLFFPYITTYDPYADATWTITGWQMFGLNSFSAPIMIIVLLVPLLPALSVMVGRLPLSFLPVQKEHLLAGSITLSYWLNLLGFLLSGIVLANILLFIGTDFNKEIHWPAAVSVLPTSTFLLALLCSGILRACSMQWQSQAKAA